MCPYFSGIAYADDAGICTVCEVFLESPGQMDFRCDLYTGIYQYSCPAYTSAYRNKGIQADVHSYTYFIGYGSDVYGRSNSLCNVEAWDKSAGDCRYPGHNRAVRCTDAGFGTFLFRFIPDYVYW